MARLDRIKTSLVCGMLWQERGTCKKIAPNGCREVEGRESGDNEERDEIEKLYRIDQYNLYGKIRWLGVCLTKTESGEIYRVLPIIRVF